jgi:hypothetical protein
MMEHWSVPQRGREEAVDLEGRSRKDKLGTGWSHFGKRVELRGRLTGSRAARHVVSISDHT